MLGMLDRIARARAKARAHVWTLIGGTPAGFPWLVIAGKTLAGWLVIDMDATLVTARSDKERAAPMSGTATRPALESKQTADPKPGASTISNRPLEP